MRVTLAAYNNDEKVKIVVLSFHWLNLNDSANYEGKKLPYTLINI